MATSVNLRKLLHRKAWEFCTPSPSNTAAGSWIDSDKSDVIPLHDCTYFVNGASGIFNYNADQDAWLQLPNSGIAGSFGAGSCGEFLALGMIGGVAVNTASAGTTTTITMPASRTLARNLSGCRIRVIAGAGAGYDGTIASNTIGATNPVITVSSPSGVAFNSTTMFEVYSGSLWFFNAGTTAVGFSVYDRASNTWTAKSVTSLPTAWGTCGQLVGTPAITGSFDTGTASAGAATTITTTKSYLLNAVANHQVRITAGTGAGQSRVIISSTAGPNSVLTTSSATTALTAMTRAATGIVTATVASAAAPNLVPGRGYTVTASSDATLNATYTILTVSGTTITMLGANTTVQAVAQTGTGQDTWIVNPDATSQFAIEGNAEQLILMGNNATALYRYSIGANTWTTLTARGGATATGSTADWVDGVPEWNASTMSLPLIQGGSIVKQNGRFILSWRGGNGSTLDVYDIALNTWVSSAVYGNATEVFNTGSCSVDLDGAIFIQKEGTGRIFRFDINRWVLEPYATNVYMQSTTQEGDKMFVQRYKDGGTVVRILYTQHHNRNELLRVVDI